MPLEFFISYEKKTESCQLSTYLFFTLVKSISIIKVNHFNILTKITLLDDVKEKKSLVPLSKPLLLRLEMEREEDQMLINMLLKF